MSEITTPRELFLHELGDILYVEEQLESEVLPMVMEDVNSPELKKGLEKHLQETRSHVENIEQVFEKLGEEPKAEECVGFEGLKAEYEQLKGEASPELADALGVSGVARTEHYEIAAYENLLAMARALGESDVVPLLEENMKADKETLRQVESLGKELLKEQAKEMSEA